MEFISEGVMANTTIAIDNTGDVPNISRSKKKSFWEHDEE